MFKASTHSETPMSVPKKTKSSLHLKIIKILLKVQKNLKKVTVVYDTGVLKYFAPVGDILIGWY